MTLCMVLKCMANVCQGLAERPGNELVPVLIKTFANRLLLNHVVLSCLSDGNVVTTKTTARRHSGQKPCQPAISLRL